MGGGSYDFQARSVRTASFAKKSTSQLFEQTSQRKSHKSMLPNAANKAHLREARDSEAHPNSVPVIIAMDVTGSMEDIPVHLIKEGLPKIVSKMMELGVKDPQIMVMAIGDSRSDNDDGVFQIGQFESADAEMDMWLSRIWISGKGGGNGGESYHWAYLYARDHVQTDAWDKRKQKGFIFTIGDDSCHSTLSSREISEYMGEVSNIKESVESKSLVDEVKEKWNIYHIQLGDSWEQKNWEDLIGKENVFDLRRNDYDGMANKIATTVASYSKVTTVTPGPQPVKEETTKVDTDVPEEQSQKITL